VDARRTLVRERFEAGVALRAATHEACGGAIVEAADRIVRAFRAGGQGTAARAPHAHTFIRPHEHAGPADHLHLGRWTLARGPLVIGLVHGLAGSGALTALVVSTIPGRGEGLLYMLLFGLGSVVGMALVTSLSSLPMRRVAGDQVIMARVAGGAGLLSLVVGVLWAAPLCARFAALT
jgi:hypothetical protein